MARQRTLCVIDHQPLFASALHQIAASIPCTRVISVAPPLAAGGITEPLDVVVMDPATEASFDLRLIRDVRSHWPACSILVLTSDTNRSRVADSLRAGADSFMLKTEPVETIALGIELVCRGAAVFSNAATRALTSLALGGPSGTSVHDERQRHLSAREVQVVQLIAKGCTDADIAALLVLSPRTVQRHVSNILNKLACRNRSEAVARAAIELPPTVQ